MTRLDELQDLAFQLLETTDGMIRRRLTNRIALTFWDKVGKNYGKNSILNSTEKELEFDMNSIYKDFKPFFENKQMKDLLDEGNKMSNIDLTKLTENKQLQKVSKYF